MNYRVEMEKIIEKNKIEFDDRVPTILLHSCCAPCSSHVIETLSPHFNITILYYNPNIEPFEEYLKRKEEEIRFINEFPHQNELNFLDCDYDNEIFHDTIKGLEKEKEGGARCFKCYFLRLSKTAEIAASNNFDFFGTTLTVSPYKNSQKLNEFGEYLSRKYNIRYLLSDFKKQNGYKRSIDLSKEYDLYRQDYCGCIYSKEERELQKSTKENEERQG